MRHQLVKINSGQTGIEFDLTYPDVKVLAFNPNFFEFQMRSGQAKYFTITCGGNSIKVTLDSKGHARANISLLFQLCFDNPREERAKTITVTIEGCCDLGFVVIWGSMSVGERLSNIGAYNYNDETKTYERHLRWFFNLPQRLCLYNNNKFDLITPTRKKYTYTILTEEQRAKGLVWADEFDDTFKEQHVWEDDDVVVYLRKDDRKCGLFLRWIDNLGYMQYFLFAEKDRKIKTTTEYTIQKDVFYGGMNFGGGKYNSKNCTESVTCAALDLHPMEIKYIKTISISPIVDMYVGNDTQGNEIWVPVTVNDGENTILHKKTMQDYEIVVDVPVSIPQQL